MSGQTQTVVSTHSNSEKKKRHITPTVVDEGPEYKRCKGDIVPSDDAWCLQSLLPQCVGISMLTSPEDKPGYNKLQPPPVNERDPLLRTYPRIDRLVQHYAFMALQQPPIQTVSDDFFAFRLAAEAPLRKHRRARCGTCDQKVVPRFLCQTLLKPTGIVPLERLNDHKEQVISFQATFNRVESLSVTVSGRVWLTSKLAETSPAQMCAACRHFFERSVRVLFPVVFRNTACKLDKMLADTLLTLPIELVQLIRQYLVINVPYTKYG